MTTAKKIAFLNLGHLELSAEIKNISGACEIKGQSRPKANNPEDRSDLLI
jgi:hypothetical protein